jgi:YD repeat-containing protein
VRRLLVCAAAAHLVAGCADNERYPKNLRYPLRTDVLVTKTPTAEKRQLPPPGHLEEDIRRAVEAELKAKKTDASAKNDEDKLLDPKDVAPAGRKALAAALHEVFGTPELPKVAVSDDLIDALKVDERTLWNGSKHYRRHCLHCHGLTGNGNGPTGPWVHPHPRDYRRGQFKYISSNPTVPGAKARRADLLRVLAKGIDGTSMPSFGLLEEKEREEMVSYVIHLSIRGETEFEVMRSLLGGTPLEPGAVAAEVQKKAQTLAKRWKETNDSVNTPPPYPEELGTDEAKRKESVARGYELFIGRGACISCHLDFGRQSAYKYDAWGTLVRPRDLTAGVFRGGRRPVDVYYRITRGIVPSQMPSLGVPVESNPPNAKPEEKKITHADAWDLVNFVQALPYPAMLPDKVKAKIYGGSPPPRSTAHASLTR